MLLQSPHFNAFENVISADETAKVFAKKLNNTMKANVFNVQNASSKFLRGEKESYLYEDHIKNVNKMVYCFYLKSKKNFNTDICELINKAINDYIEYYNKNNNLNEPTKAVNTFVYNYRDDFSVNIKKSFNEITKNYTYTFFITYDRTTTASTKAI